MTNVVGTTFNNPAWEDILLSLNVHHQYLDLLFSHQLTDPLESFYFPGGLLLNQTKLQKSSVKSQSQFVMWTKRGQLDVL